MSNPPSAGDQHGDPSRSTGDETNDHGGWLERLMPTMAKPIRKASFWGAIVLPVWYLPLLAVGLSSRFQVALFVCLVAVNLGALYVGHGHRRDRSTARTSPPDS